MLALGRAEALEPDAALAVLKDAIEIGARLPALRDRLLGPAWAQVRTRILRGLAAGAHPDVDRPGRGRRRPDQAVWLRTVALAAQPGPALVAQAKALLRSAWEADVGRGRPSATSSRWPGRRRPAGRRGAPEVTTPPTPELPERPTMADFQAFIPGPGGLPRLARCGPGPQHLPMVEEVGELAKGHPQAGSSSPRAPRPSEDAARPTSAKSSSTCSTTRWPSRTASTSTSRRPSAKNALNLARRWA
ncbi:MAG: hypothetical protein R3F43_00345 [bacterium]